MRFIRKLFTAGALVLSCVFASAHAVEAEETKSERAEEEQSRKDDAEEKKRPFRTRDDLDSCKRDAEGLKGPERARFMTECLRER